MTTKTFDAVEMKRRVQNELAREHAGQSDAERRSALESWLDSGEDAAARLWRRARKPAPDQSEGPGSST
jgi:hypothetical protein